MLFLVMMRTPGAAMSLKVLWCKHSHRGIKSPAFALAGVPDGTRKPAFQMNDLNLQNFAPDGDTIAFGGLTRIPTGAFDYAGPCSDSGDPHVYRPTATALDAGGQVLATAP